MRPAPLWLGDLTFTGASCRSLFLIFVFGVCVLLRLCLRIFSGVRFRIDLLGKLAEFFVRLRFFVQSGFEKRSLFGFAQLFRKGADGPVSGDLVVGKAAFAILGKAFTNWVSAL